MSAENVRDHLANERTFLAWVRTSIALMGFGVVITRLRFMMAQAVVVQAGQPPPGARSTVLGLGFAVIGLLTLVFALRHYTNTRRAIDAGDYQAAGHTLVAFVAVIFLLGLACILYLLTWTPL